MKPKWQVMYEEAMAEKRQHDMRTRQFAVLERIERLINTSVRGDITYAGIRIEDLSRKTLNVLAKAVILNDCGELQKLEQFGYIIEDVEAKFNV